MPGADGRALEVEAEDAIVDAARTMGYRAHVQRKARTKDGNVITAVKGDVGFPDLVIAGYGHIFIYELKRRGGTFRPGQREWLEAFHLCPATEVHSGVLWVPEQQQVFIDRLAEIRDAWMLG